ncbi:MAG: nitrate reductase cytochrome c-type subunit [Betaproteobacteria bacterium]|nr:nitrate reductase cytochrome c-type subunit [Betaproteobacteria bacterium]
MSKAPTTLPLVLAAAAFVLSTSLLAQDRPQSLRGATPITETSKVDQYQRGPDQGPIPRDYVQQPPLIPHKIDGYRIDLNFNKCMDCHAWSKAKEAGATKVSLTHFRDQASGAELANISPSRYFCNQCHVPQVDAKPLVGNDFKPVDALAQPGRK